MFEMKHKTAEELPPQAFWKSPSFPAVPCAYEKTAPCAVTGLQIHTAVSSHFTYAACGGRRLNIAGPLKSLQILVNPGERERGA